MATKPAVVDDTTFISEVVEGSNDQPVLVDFWATWCGPCKMVAPIVEQINDEQSGKLKVVKVDVDENPQASGQFGIMSIPTLVLFKGGTEVKRIVGYRPKDYIMSQIQQYL
jgi:thioredoxin 1